MSTLDLITIPILLDKHGLLLGTVLQFIPKRKKKKVCWAAYSPHHTHRDFYVFQKCSLAQLSLKSDQHSVGR